MKLKSIVQIILVSCSVLALSSCSTTGRNSDDMNDQSAAINDINGAEAQGIGEGKNFGGEMGARQLNKRTYYFDYDSNVVHEADKPAIAANAHYLIAHSHAKTTVEGHTDPRGSREYNVALGERRANAVADVLRSQGVNPSQIRVVSYGAERASAGRTEQDYQQDRRAVIVYQ